jgi:hypothetical protein
MNPSGPGSDPGVRCSEPGRSDGPRRRTNAVQVLDLIDDLDLDSEERLIEEFQQFLTAIEAIIHDGRGSLPGFSSGTCRPQECLHRPPSSLNPVLPTGPKLDSRPPSPRQVVSWSIS